MHGIEPYPLTTQCACLDEKDQLWMVSNTLNALFCVNIDTEQVQYVTSFDQEPMICKDLYTKAIWYQGKMICIPCTAKNIAIYAVETKETRYVPIRNEDYLVYFNTISLNESRILLFPVIYSKYAYIFDLDTESYETILLEYGKNKHKVRNKIVQGDALCNGKVYFIIRETDIYFSFDIESHIIQFYKADNHQLFFSMASDGKYLYLFHTDGCGYDVYQNQQYIETRKLLPKETDVSCIIPYENMNYIASFCEKGQVINLPMKNNSLKLFQNGYMKDIPLDWNRICMVDLKVQAFSLCIQYNEKLLLLPYHCNTIVQIDLISGISKYFNINVTEEVIGKLYHILSNTPELMGYGVTEYLMPITLFLNVIQTLDTKKKEKPVMQLKETKGYAIYDYLKRKEDLQ